MNSRELIWLRLISARVSVREQPSRSQGWRCMVEVHISNTKLLKRYHMGRKIHKQSFSDHRVKNLYALCSSAAVIFNFMRHKLCDCKFHLLLLASYQLFPKFYIKLGWNIGRITHIAVVEHALLARWDYLTDYDFSDIMTLTDCRFRNFDDLQKWIKSFCNLACQSIGFLPLPRLSYLVSTLCHSAVFALFCQWQDNSSDFWCTVRLFLIQFYFLNFKQVWVAVFTNFPLTSNSARVLKLNLTRHYEH